MKDPEGLVRVPVYRFTKKHQTSWDNPAVRPIAGHLIVDEADEELVRAHTWILHPEGYAVATAPRNILLHRLILGLTPGDRKQVDHVNGNLLDNRRINLRVLTDGQNKQNLPTTGRQGTSQYRGVCWEGKTQRWLAQVTLEGNQYRLGLYYNELDAAKIAAAFRVKHMPYTHLHDAALAGDTPAPDLPLRPPVPGARSATRGVVYARPTKTWQVRRSVQGTKRFYGSYQDEETASLVSREFDRRKENRDALLPGEWLHDFLASLETGHAKRC